MPKIKITDYDNTGVVQSSTISNTVYIPGKSCYKKDTSSSTIYAVSPVLFSSVSALNTFNYGTGSEPIYYDVNSLSYKLMVHLLGLGMQVLYEGVTENSNGSLPTIDWTRLEDKGNYDIRFLTIGGYIDETSLTNQAGMITCAASRGDCIALLSHPTTFSSNYSLIESAPSDWSTAWSTKYALYVYKRETGYNELKTYVPFLSGIYYECKSSTGSTKSYDLLTTQPADWTITNFPTEKYYTISYTYTLVGGTSAPTFNKNTYYLISTSQVESVRNYFESFKGANDTSYAAAFTPNFTTKLATLGGSDTSPVTIPASFGYLFAYAKDVKTYPEWYAIAGGTRGLIDELNSVNYRYTSADIEMLQARSTTTEVELDADEDNVGCAINPIAYVRPFGYIIWGNRTFKNNDATLKTTASSFLNVRNLVSAVKKSLYNAARKFTFDQNSDILWVNFKSQVIPLLDEMKNGNGILGYKFVKLATTAKARLKARLIIIPIEAVEDFEIEVELSDSISTTENA